MPHDIRCRHRQRESWRSRAPDPSRCSTAHWCLCACPRKQARCTCSQGRCRSPCHQSEPSVRCRSSQRWVARVEPCKWVGHRGRWRSARRSISLSAHRRCCTKRRSHCRVDLASFRIRVQGPLASFCFRPGMWRSIPRQWRYLTPAAKR